MNTHTHTLTKTRPIIFGAEMITAILEDRKTMTRRVIKPQPAGGVRLSPFVPSQLEDGHGREIRPRFYVGDTLWVRETWAPISPDEYRRPIGECNIEYRADTPNAPYPGEWPEEEARGNDDAPKWRSPIHMPKWASRITLEIVDVRVEQLQSISHDDILAEGIPTHKFARGLLCDDWHPQKPFADLWDSINGKRPGCSWADNPYIWAITFRRVTP